MYICLDHNASNAGSTQPIDGNIMLQAWQIHHAGSRGIALTARTNFRAQSHPGRRWSVRIHNNVPFNGAYSTSVESTSSQGKGSHHDSFRDYSRSLAFPASTQCWQDLAKLNDDGSQVVIHGYVGPRKKISKNLIFQRLLSPDLKADIQLVCSAKPGANGTLSFPEVATSSRHSPVTVRGKVKQIDAITKARTDAVNAIRHIEIEVVDSMLLNSFPSEVMLTSDKTYRSEERHLEIRGKSEIRTALQARSEAASIVRETFLNDDFLEVETPILFKSTPEGAREFLVPTRHNGKAYALPQSPQQYKQILMASGIPRYFQIARCFRDEDLRIDRQPEFTQIDYEMAFADDITIRGITEQVISRLWQRFHPSHAVKPGSIDAIPYQEVMNTYGSDKPDRRFGMQVSDITSLVQESDVYQPNHRVEMLKFSITADNRLVSNSGQFADKESARQLEKIRRSLSACAFMKDVDRKMEIIGFENGEGHNWNSNIINASSITNLKVTPGEFVLLLSEPATSRTAGWTTMGRLRDQLHRDLVDSGLLPAPQGFDFLWVVDFPLFSPTVDNEPGQGGAAGLAATHHPFTAPKTAEDLALLSTNPLSAVAAHYDLVVNGVELGGGSRRIHNGHVQEHILRDVLRVPEAGIASLQHLIDALKVGCPPHAGMALGFDRLLAVLLGYPSVKDVIAFPKNNRGEDLMVGSPNRITPEQLKPYHLSVVEQEDITRESHALEANATKI